MTDHDASRRENWRWAPVEPTEAMIQAACDATFGRDPLTPESAHRKGYAAMLAATPTPEAVEGLEPPGCPTPSACSCPDGEAELAKRLTASEAACAETRARCEAAEKEADYLRMGWDGLCAKLKNTEARCQVLEEALLMCAAHCQGAHSDAGRKAADALGIESFPISMTGLEAAAIRLWHDPRKLWPWLSKFRAAAALNPKAETGR